MSAYIVSKETIDAIVTFSTTPQGQSGIPIYSIKPIPGWNGAGDHMTISDLGVDAPSRIGQLLWHENVLSVNYRYREDDDTAIYKFKHRVEGCVAPDEKRRLTAVDIIKLCGCLEYQSCEHPGWADSWAKDFLDRVVRAAIHELPGYDDAPWGLYPDKKRSLA